MAKNYYKTLGISQNVSDEEIRKAFKKLARKFHPDVNPGDKKAEEKFKEISEAYNVLSDPKKKKQYDTFGSADFEGFPGGGPGGRSATYSYSPYGGGVKYSSNFDFGDLNDLFGDIFGGMGGMGGRGGGARPARGVRYEPSQEPRMGKDLHFSIDLDFLEAVKGCEKKIRLSNGALFTVKIPAGIKDGSKIRLAGKGEPGLLGGPAGDLYIEPRIKAHPFFRREEDDIYLDLPITVVEALEGTKVPVPTIDGNVQLKIPSGAQSGQKLRLKGKGVTNRQTRQRGDQYAVLKVQAPENLDDQTRDAVLEILKKNEKNPRTQW